MGKVLITREGSRERVWSAPGYPVQDGGISDDLGVSALKRAIRLSESRVLVTSREVTQARTEVIVASHVLEDRQPVGAVELVDLVGDTECRLGGIWAAVLRLDAVSRDDTFVGLGGDSLYATQAVSQIRKEFGVRLSPASMLGGCSLAELAELLESDVSPAAT